MDFLLSKGLSYCPKVRAFYFVLIVVPLKFIRFISSGNEILLRFVSFDDTLLNNIAKNLTYNRILSSYLTYDFKKNILFSLGHPFRKVGDLIQTRHI